MVYDNFFTKFLHSDDAADCAVLATSSAVAAAMRVERIFGSFCRETMRIFNMV